MPFLTSVSEMTQASLGSYTCPRSITTTKSTGCALWPDLGHADGMKGSQAPVKYIPNKEKGIYFRKGCVRDLSKKCHCPLKVHVAQKINMVGSHRVP